MGIGDLLGFGRKRRTNLGLSISGVADVALARTGPESMDERRARLWETLCFAAQQTLHQLLVKKDDDRMDWGLRRHAGRVDDIKLVVLFWWMLIYQIVVFKNRGLDGYKPEEETGPLYEAAKRFVEAEFVRLKVGMEPPGPWAKNWNRQFTLESAMDMYNNFYNLLGLDNDLTQRINHVSHFTTITEQAYDRLVKESHS